MKNRPTTPKALRALKVAFRRTVDLCGGLESAASITRPGFQTLATYGNTANPAHEAAFAPLDVVLDLSLDCAERGDVPPVLQELSRQAGGVFVPLPHVHVHGGGDVAKGLADAVRHHADAASALCLALADDGIVSPEEIRQGEIIQKLDLLLTDAMRLKTVLGLVLEAEQKNERVAGQ